MHTLGDLRPTEISEGLAGNSFNAAHLTRTYGVDKPHDLSLNSKNMTMLFSGTDKFYGKPMLGMLEGKGKSLKLTSNEYTWKVMGSQVRETEIKSNLETTDRPGENYSTIRVVLESGRYDLADVLIGEDENYPLEIIKGPRKQSNGFLYELRLQTASASDFLPKHLIEPGQTLVKVSSSVQDEMNKRYGTVELNTIYELRGTMSNAAIKKQVTDKMLRVDKNSNTPQQKATHWRVPYLDNTGKTYYNFMPLIEATVWDRLYKDVEWALQFGRYSTRVVDGYLKKTGSGLREQMQTTNALFHNGNLSIVEMEEFLSNIHRGRTAANENERKTTVKTGEEGRIMLHNMISDEMAIYSLIDTKFIQGKDPRYLTFGAQFTQYIGKNGITITSMLDPCYDNPEWSRKKHPRYPDRPINSWRMDIMDFGDSVSYEGKAAPNIQMVSERYADHYIVTSGKWDAKSGMPINDGGEGNIAIGGYQMICEKSFGLLVRDRSRMGFIDLAFND